MRNAGCSSFLRRIRTRGDYDKVFADDWRCLRHSEKTGHEGRRRKYCQIDACANHIRGMRYAE